MRTLFFILFGIVLCHSSKGQYFNKSYVYPSYEIQAILSIDEISPDTFFVIAANWNLSNTNIGIGTFLINSTGDTLSTNSWIDTTKNLYVGWSNSTTPTQDEGFIMGGG